MQSSWNIPLLPIRKLYTNNYRLVQDLQEVNNNVTDIHLSVPNHYTLLSLLLPDRQWYTVLDLKDAFFNLSLAPKSQQYFTFKWHNPEIGISSQLTRPILHKDSKTLPPSLMKLCMRTWISTGHRTQTSACCSMLMTYGLQPQNKRPACLELSSY